MLFAVAYIAEARARKEKVLKLLRHKAYLPPAEKSVKGNRLVIEFLKSHSVNEALKALLGLSHGRVYATTRRT